MNMFERINQQLLAGCSDGIVPWHKSWSAIVDPDCVICRDDDEEEVFQLALHIAFDYQSRGPQILITESAEAFYSWEKDVVTSPCREQFTNDADYCCTLFHEMVHSTGSASRLGRKKPDQRHTPHEYCEEELIAEIGALYLCGIVGYIGGDVFEQSVAYVRSYKNQVNATDEQLLNVAMQAKRAVCYILGNTD